MAAMQDEMTLIADRVRGVAAEKRKDQEAIASILGISRQSVNQRFNGRVPFTAAELYRISMALDEPVSRFFPTARTATSSPVDSAPSPAESTGVSSSAASSSRDVGAAADQHAA